MQASTETIRGDAIPAGLRAGISATGRACPRIVRRISFTLTLLGTVWLLAVITGSIGHGVPAEVNARFGFAPIKLLDGHAYTIVTSVLFIHKRFMVGPLNLSILILLLPYEWAAGTRRAFAVFWAGHVLESALSAAVVLVLAAHGYPPAIHLRALADVGMSSGTLACAGALLTVLPRRLKWPAALALGLYLLAMLLVSHQVYDVDHALVAPLGFAIALFVSRPARPREGTRL